MLHGHYFGEENVVLSLKPDWGMYAKMGPDQFYEVVCSSISGELLIFDVWNLSSALKSEPRVIKMF